MEILQRLPIDLSNAADPQSIARIHLKEIDRKIGDLTALRAEFDRVIGSCRRETVADCKIIETLAVRASVVQPSNLPWSIH